MFIFPVQTDSPVRRVPYVNWAIIGINALAYGLLDVLGGRGAGGWGDAIKRPLMLWPLDIELPQFLTYQFLHADLTHLLGNMYFLWMFGNSVNAKMGHLTYALFYLASGVFAGLGFAVQDSGSPCLGASGAVAGVTTAYLAMFPRSEVTVFYWIFIYIGTTQVGSLLWILGKMILWDNWYAMQSGAAEYTSVAYEAHLAGYFFGFFYCIAMLSTRALPRDQYDMLALMKRWYLRQTFRTVMNDPDARARAQYGRVARPVDPQTGRPVAAPAAAGPMAPLRAEITELMGRGDFTTAADKYLELIARDGQQVLPRKQQLDVANQLMSLNRHPQAAEAYERFLKHYPKPPDAEQVMLLLGILYVRYLQRYDLARKYLGECVGTLANTQQRDQARHWLDVANEASFAPSSAPPSS